MSYNEIIKQLKWDEWYYCIPEGWHNICRMMFYEFINACQSLNVDPRDLDIVDMKEKYGMMRCDCFCPSCHEDLQEILDQITSKYEDVSMGVCAHCGKLATVLSAGWICPYCEDCLKELNLKRGEPIC